MSGKSKGVTTNATMDSLGKKPDELDAGTLEELTEHPEPAAGDAGDAAIIEDVEDAVIIEEAELAVPVSDYDDRAAELARREARATNTVAVRAHPATRALDAWLAEHQEQGTEADMAQGDIIAQVLTANTLEEILTPAEALHAEAVMDEPLSVFAVKYQRSDYQEGSPFYAVLDVWRHNWEERTIVTVGAQSIIAQLVRLVQLGMLPTRVRIVKATKKPTRNGYWPLRLIADKSGPVHEL